MKELLDRGSRRGLVATVVAAVFAASGATAIALSVTAQMHPTEPSLSAAGSLGPAAVPPKWSESPSPTKTLPSAAGSLGPAALSPTPSESPRPSDSIPAARSSPDPAPKDVGPVLPPSKPVSIDIPMIDVHSTLQYLGLTAQGALEVPAPGPHYDEAAWYKYSPTPGSLGPAVISGHVDSATQGPSVFFDLGDLRPGDNVLVTRADGLVAVFGVDGVRSYPKDDFPTMLVYGHTEHAALRLITCGGPFDYETGHYVDNIVVFASLVGSH